MTDNYPLGAARDPRAPYNQPMEREMDVTARQSLYKDLTLWTDDEHVLTNDDLTEIFHEQHRSPLEIINVCEKSASRKTCEIGFIRGSRTRSQDCQGCIKMEAAIR